MTKIEIVFVNSHRLVKQVIKYFITLTKFLQLMGIKKFWCFSIYRSSFLDQIYFAQFMDFVRSCYANVF